MVDHGDRVKLTGVLAQFATHTANLAVVADQIAFLSRAAQKPHGKGFGLKAQHVLGACLYAGSTTLALLGIHFGDSGVLVNVDGIKLAGPHAGTQAEACILAGAVSVVDQSRRYTVLDAVILEFGFATVQSALTDYGRHIAHLLRRFFHTHDFGDFRRCRGTAHRAGVHRSLPCGNRIRQRIAAGKSASAAVCAGKRIAYRITLGIGRNFKHLVGYGQQQAQNQSKAAQYPYADQNSSHS